MRIPSRPARLLCLLLASTSPAILAAAQAQEAAGAATPPAQPQAQQPVANASTSTDEIVVTGQALPGAVIGDIPPENQIGPGEIASYGVDSISDLLNEIADQTTSIAGRDASSGPVILVNGKRVSGVNEVGDLPTESVLRVDILPEEVAIKYGYDAQQKVVNIILKRRFQSKVAALGGGMATQGEGGQGNGAFTYTRIRDANRINLTGKVTGQASILESDRDIAPDPDSEVTPAGGIASESDYRTLRPSTRNYSMAASLARELGSTATASFNIKGNYQTSRSLNGLPTGQLTVPAGNPYSNGVGTSFNRYLSTDALDRKSNSGDLSAGGTVNVDLSTRWKLSVIGAYQHSESESWSDNGYDLTALQAAIDAGDPAVDPWGTLPSSLLGDMRVNHATSNTDTASASALVTGKVLRLPAGDIGVSLKAGGDLTSQTSTSERGGAEIDSDADRSRANGQLSVDVPLTSRSKGVLGAIGTLSVNLNAGVTQVSDYGALGTFGYGLNWKPMDRITVIAAFNQDRNAPSINNLSNPIVVNSNQRVYDYVTGQTVLVTTITGGNPDLDADDRRSFKLGVNVQAMDTPKLNFSANYVNSRTRDATMSLGGVTEEMEEAFPDRFVRDASGTLISVDSRPVNVYRQRSQQIRWGFNLSTELRKPKRPERPPWMGQGGRGFGRAQGNSEGERQGVPGQQGAVEAAPEDRQRDSANPGPGEITVTGEREREGQGGGAGFGPPPEGMGPPPEGMGPPPEGMGPPGGAGEPGGPGGRRGFRGRGFTGGSDNGMRLLASFYHTWILRQDVQLTPDSDVIDLLNGGTISGNATPQHKIQASLGLIDNGVGLRMEGNWQSGTTVTGESSSSANGDLHFSSLATLDVRLFANLQNRFRGQKWASGTRVSLSVENLFDQRQRVTDDMGATPYAYQRDFLDPMGRTVMLSVRRIF